jgi:hypothetical protein
MSGASNQSQHPPPTSQQSMRPIGSPNSSSSGSRSMSPAVGGKLFFVILINSSLTQ